MVSGTPNAKIDGLAATVTRLAGAVASTAFVVFLARLVSAGKEAFVASRFGAGHALDAYLVAFALPSFIVNVLGAGLTVTLVPVLVRALPTPERARQTFSSVFTLFAAVILIATALLAVFGRWLVPALAPGFAPAQLHETRRLLLLLVFALPLAAMSALFGAPLMAANRVRLVAVTPAITPAVIVLAVWLNVLQSQLDALAAGTVVGLGCEAAVLGFACYKLGYRWSGRSHPNVRAEVRGVLREYFAASLGALTSSASPLVDQAVASVIGSGAIAELAFGNRLIALAMGVGASSLGLVMLPHFSTLSARRDWTGFARQMRLWVLLLAGASALATAALVGTSSQLVRIFFQHGAFTAQMASQVSRVQAMYALQIPFHLVGILGVRALSSLSANSSIMLISVINVVVNAGADVVLAKTMGVPGIALSTSLVFCVSSVLILLAVRQKLIRLQQSELDTTAPLTELGTHE